MNGCCILSAPHVQGFYLPSCFTPRPDVVRYAFADTESNTADITTKTVMNSNDDRFGTIAGSERVLTYPRRIWRNTSEHYKEASRPCSPAGREALSLSVGKLSSACQRPGDCYSSHVPISLPSPLRMRRLSCLPFLVSIIMVASLALGPPPTKTGKGLPWVPGA